MQPKFVTVMNYFNSSNKISSLSSHYLIDNIDTDETNATSDVKVSTLFDHYA